MQNILSTPKKALGILFVAALLLALPVTLVLVSQEQDIRQSAAPISQCTVLSQQLSAYQSSGVCPQNVTSICTILTNYMQQLGCSLTPVPTGVGNPVPTPVACTPSNPVCPTGFSCITDNGQGLCLPNPTTPTPTCKQKPSYCNTWLGRRLSFICREPSGGWCGNTTPTPSPSPTPEVSEPTLSPTPTSTQSSTLTPTLTLTPSPTKIASPTPDLPLTDSQRIFDFNDDGKIDEKDLNILYVGFTNRLGD